jgi:hypothetical protein
VLGGIASENIGVLRALPATAGPFFGILREPMICIGLERLRWMAEMA